MSLREISKLEGHWGGFRCFEVVAANEGNRRKDHAV